MKGPLLRLRLGLGRVPGVQALREAVEARSGAVRVPVATKVEVLRAELTDRLVALDKKVEDLGIGLAGLHSEGIGWARAAQERSDALASELNRSLAELGSSERSSAAARGFADAIEKSVAELRVEISAMRADFAREVEMLSEEVKRSAPATASDVPG